MMRQAACFTVILAWAASTASAQQAEDVRRLLDQLKEEYQQKIQDLEQRLASRTTEFPGRRS